MKKVKILLFSSILFLIISVIFWFDSYSHNHLLKTERLDTKEADCFLQTRVSNSLIAMFFVKKGYTKEEVTCFFSCEGKVYLEEVDKNDFVLKYVLNQTEDKILNFNKIMNLKSTDIYFLFENDTLVQVISSCTNYKSFDLEYYLKNGGKFQTLD